MVSSLYIFLQNGKDNENGREIIKNIISKILISSFVFSVVLYIFSAFSDRLATEINSGICQRYRDFLRGFSDAFSVSLFEILVIASPFLLLIMLLRIIFASGKNIHRRFAFLLSLVLIIPINYILTLGIGYKTEVVYSAKDNCTAEDLYETARLLISDFDSIDNSALPTTYLECREEFSVSYGKILYNNEKSVTLGRVKPIAFSGMLDKLGIYGFYYFLSGEINVNTGIPEVSVPSCIAHEYAHLLGFSREGEAELLSYLTCMESSSDFIKYSGNMSALRCVLSDLSKKDRELYTKVYKTIPKRILFDIKKINEYNSKYKGGRLHEGGKRLNSIHLKLQDSANSDYSDFTALIVEYRLGL